MRINKNKIMLISLVLMSIVVVAVINVFITPFVVGRVDVGYRLGHFLGQVLWLLIFSILVPTIISIIINIFRKEKKYFSFILIWVAFFVCTLSMVTSAFQERPKLMFISGCIKGYEESSKDIASQEVKDFCGKYADLYIGCLKTRNDDAFCWERVTEKFSKDLEAGAVLSN